MTKKLDFEQTSKYLRHIDCKFSIKIQVSFKIKGKNFTLKIYLLICWLILTFLLHAYLKLEKSFKFRKISFMHVVRIYLLV